MLKVLTHTVSESLRSTPNPRDALYQSISPVFFGILAFLFIAWLLSSIGLSKIFEKWGIEKWKAFIPLFNIYVLCLEVWEKKSFIVLGGFMILIPFFAFIRLGNPWSIIFAFLIVIMFIVYLSFFYVLMLRLSRKSGHSISFALGLLFFNCIFMLILGFEKPKKHINYN